MPEPHNQHLDHTIDLPSPSSAALDAGMAAGFRRRSEPPRSSLGDLRPVLLKEAEGESDLVVKPNSDAMPPRSEAGDRYQLSGEIARGGMGVVLRGRDVDLGRDLAVKVLLEQHAHRPEIARRFIEEAQIGGQLQHPGVVPVYDIGHFGDRPFFTMKLVRGQTLAALLSDRNDPTTEHPRLLGIALQIAQALAYAHAKGVIHRDLKPANVMVGAFGEVQVMDWGLAKVLVEGGIADEERANRAHQEPADVTTIRTARSSGSTGRFGTETEMGSLLGTPAYMPPEQANGDVDHVDRRADVFGLGAIVCEILTGKPPYVGRSSEEVRRKAANGDLADATARLDDCGADAELIALTKKCLSPEAIDRPKDAQEVTDGLSAYLNGVQERLQTAERERAVAVARAEEEAKTRQVAEEKAAEQRKRRRVQAQLAAVVAVLILGGVTAAWWQTKEAGARREAELRRQVEDEQRAAADAGRLARNAEAVASLLGQAEEALKAGDAAKAAVALEAAKKRSAEGGAEQDAGRLGRLEADLALLRDLDAVDEFRWTPLENRIPEPAAVSTRFRDALRRFGADPHAVPVDAASAKVSASVVRERVVATLDLVLAIERTAGVGDLLRRLDPDGYRDAVRNAVVARDWAKFTGLAGRKEATEQPPGFTASLGIAGMIPAERRQELLRAAVARRPGDLSMLMLLGSPDQPKGAGQKKEAAEERVRWCQAAVSVAPGNVVAHSHLGIALEAMGDLAGAVAAHRRAVELGPNKAPAHHNLGTTLLHAGDGDGAVACYRRAIELNPGEAEHHFALTGALVGTRDQDGAVAAGRRAVELFSKSAGAHRLLGYALASSGRLDEAVASFRKAIELDPKNAGAHDDLGDALMEKRDLVGAIASYRKAIELDPGHARAHHSLGLALSIMEDQDGAIVALRRAVELDPVNAKAHHKLGAALGKKRDWDGALASFSKAAELDPMNAQTHLYLGIALKEKGDLDGSLASYRRAAELDPKSAQLHNNLGAALSAKGDLDGAVASFRRATEIDPGYAKAQANLGSVLSSKGDLDGAIVCFRKTLELDPNFDPVRTQLAQAERLVAAGNKLQAFLKGDYTPGSKAEQLDLIEWCRVKKLPHAGLLVFAAAFAADPQLADDLTTGHRYNAACYAALAAAGKGEDAGKLDDQERTRLRKQALEWLRADLILREKQLDSGQPADRAAVQRTVRHWQQDPDLADIRDAAPVTALPEEEQTTFTQFWADVAALLKSAEEKPK